MNAQHGPEGREANAQEGLEFPFTLGPTVILGEGLELSPPRQEVFFEETGVVWRSRQRGPEAIVLSS